MGAAKVIANSMTYNEYLYWYIEKGDVAKVEEVIAKKPEVLTQPLKVHTKATALNRACYNGNMELVKLFVEKYEVDINLPSERGETPLIVAAKRNKLEIVRYLLAQKADADFLSSEGFLAIEYSILNGFYAVSQLILEAMTDKKILRSAQQYAHLGKHYKCRYVDYAVFLDELLDQIPSQDARDFLTIPKVKYMDPVIDPRETWGQWAKRTLQFKDPPICERSELAEQDQPQNQKYARMSHVLTKLTLSPLSPMPSLNKIETETELHEKSEGSFKKAEKELEVQSLN